MADLFERDSFRLTCYLQRTGELRQYFYACIGRVIIGALGVGVGLALLPRAVLRAASMEPEERKAWHQWWGLVEDWLRCLDHLAAFWRAIPGLRACWLEENTYRQLRDLLQEVYRDRPPPPRFEWEGCGQVQRYRGEQDEQAANVWHWCLSGHSVERLAREWYPLKHGRAARATVLRDLERMHRAVYGKEPPKGRGGRRLYGFDPDSHWHGWNPCEKCQSGRLCRLARRLVPAEPPQPKPSAKDARRWWWHEVPVPDDELELQSFRRKAVGPSPGRPRDRLEAIQCPFCGRSEGVPPFACQECGTMIPRLK